MKKSKQQTQARALRTATNYNSSSNFQARERTIIFQGKLIDQKTLNELRVSYEARENSKNYNRVIIDFTPLNM